MSTAHARARRRCTLLALDDEDAGELLAKQAVYLQPVLVNEHELDLVYRPADEMADVHLDRVGRAKDHIRARAARDLKACERGAARVAVRTV